MSKSTLSTLKSEINMESRSADKAGSGLKSLDKSISNAMDDRVGNSARESVTCIYNTFSYNADKFFKGANNAASALDRGYSKLDSLVAQGEKHLSQAKAIVKGVGEL
ncbi:MAG: hypothetical protein J6A95_06270 [Clostridia bacterium]|nr:hypothetical protein [Clostridia bacterium]